jgi:hypothetical protein
MNLTRQDLVKLRFPLIFLGLTLVLVTLFVAYADHRKSGARQSRDMQQGKLNQARQRYQTSGTEKETITKYLPLYQELIDDGFVGEERRIEWVDSLRNIHEEHKLFGINYTIATQEEYKPTFALNVGPFALHRSVMKLELSMLHEGDLLTLVKALEEDQSTPFLVRDCEVTRTGSAISSNLTPNLRANCELDWLTIREPQAAGAQQ